MFIYVLSNFIYKTQKELLKGLQHAWSYNLIDYDLLICYIGLFKHGNT